MYATDAVFVVCIDNFPIIWKRRMDCWIAAFQSAIPRIGSLQISRHWKLLQPQRWQGHVGFYIRIDHSCSDANTRIDDDPVSCSGKDSPLVDSRGLKVTTGTYPV